MKNIIITILIVASILPIGVRAQTNAVPINQEILLQLIALLQKQVAVLVEQLAQVQGAADRCPNISGIQSKIPEGFIYSKTYEKCLTERELDELEEKEVTDDSCEVSENEVTKLREEYIGIDDEIDAIKKEIPGESQGTTLHLKKEDVSAFIVWIEKYYTPTNGLTKKKIEYTVSFPTEYYFGGIPPVGKGILANGCSYKGCNYSEGLIQMALQVILLEKEKDSINSKIQRAEIEVDEDCD